MSGMCCVDLAHCTALPALSADGHHHAQYCGMLQDDVRLGK